MPGASINAPESAIVRAGDTEPVVVVPVALMHKGILDPGVARLCYPVNALMRNGKLDPGVALLRKPYLPLKLLDKVREVLDSGDD